MIYLARGCVERSSCRKDLLMEGLPTNNAPNSASLGKNVNIEPQKIQLKQRPNWKNKVNFQAKKEQNAVDIYFLLDLTGKLIKK